MAPALTVHECGAGLEHAALGAVAAPAVALALALVLQDAEGLQQAGRQAGAAVLSHMQREGGGIQLPEAAEQQGSSGAGLRGEQEAVSKRRPLTLARASATGLLTSVFFTSATVVSMVATCIRVAAGRVALKGGAQCCHAGA
jgi:hypothetical protein